MLVDAGCLGFVYCINLGGDKEFYDVAAHLVYMSLSGFK
jgi:hypothetical protein